jgi:23S rRNA (cytosine1962-C5)-methyltransferase
MLAETSAPPCISLKKGKERPILQKHQWIYSGAIQSIPNEGLLVEVRDFSGKKLGLAFLNRGHSIAAHMMTLGDETVKEALHRKIASAATLRREWFDEKTNAIRLINAEGDGLPGLIVDAYDKTLVVQISHAGMDTLREEIVEGLVATFAPRSIYEKSTSFLRKKGGTPERRGWLYGEETGPVEALERGLKFSVDFIEGQKTGLFLDQREMRAQVRELSSQRRVLNAFAYTGGFSVAALAGGASHVDSVEISARCGPMIDQNLTLNDLPISKHQFIQQDVFNFLKPDTPFDYDLVILDPPAFVKKRVDVPQAFRAYKDLNARTLQKMKPGSLLITCSCSYHIDEALFQNILFRAACEAGRDVQIVSRHRQAIDHPVSLFHPETSYLKSLVLAVK